MTVRESTIISKPGISGSAAGDVLASIGAITVGTGGTDMEANDIYVLCVLPAGHEVVDFTLDTDKLETTSTALTLTAAVLLADKSDIVAAAAGNFLTASTVAQAGGVARAAVVAGLRTTATDVDRYIGVKVVAKATTTKTAGKMRGTLLYRRKS